jgi:peptidoglycan hydrolase CwlO-like protein
MKNDGKGESYMYVKRLVSKRLEDVKRHAAATQNDIDYTETRLSELKSELTELKTEIKELEDSHK